MEVWDIKLNALIKEIIVDASYVKVWEGKIISGEKDGAIQVWDIATGAEVGAAMQGNKENIIDLVISDHNTLLSATSNRILEWDLTLRTQVGKAFQTPLGDITCIAAYEDKVLAGLSGDCGIILVWNYKRETIGDAIFAHKKPVSAIKVHKGKIISGGYDNTVKIWDMQTTLQIGDTITQKGKSALSIACTEDKIITGSMKGTIAIWDLSTNRLVEEFRAHHNRVVSVKVWKDKIISGSWDGTARVWELVQHQRVRRLLEGHGGEVLSVFIHDGKIISYGYEGVRVWDTVTGQQDVLTGRKGMLDVKEGRITFASPSFVQVWDIATRKELLLHRAWTDSTVMIGNY